MGRNTQREYESRLAAAGLWDGSASELPSVEALKAAVGPPPPTAGPVSSVEEWRAEVASLLDRGVGPQAIYDRLRVEHEEFKGSLSAIKRLVKRLKGERGVSADDVAIPVETTAGEVAQVDFGYVGKLLDPERGFLRKAWVFVMVLAHSRHMFAQIVFDQSARTWLRLHVEAFEALGGAPAVVVPDNLKAAVIRAAFAVDDEAYLHRGYVELARHYGFKIDPTPPRAPKKKGKVESAVKYVKQNFFLSCGSEDASIVRLELQEWVHSVAGRRVHGTTRRRPLEVFEEEERQALLPLPKVRFELVAWKRAKVHQDAHVLVDKALYSVPWPYIGKHVEVRATTTSLTFYIDDERVATHERAAPGKRRTIESHLPKERRDLRHRSRGYWELRALDVGPDVKDWVVDTFDSDDVLYKLRIVQNTVRMLEEHPKERANNACRRARFFGNYTYGGVKDILKKALDFEPLPEVLHDDEDTLNKPRFSRNIRELLELPLEAHHEPN